MEKLKRDLILQSFSPLFLLLTIRYFSFLSMQKTILGMVNLFSGRVDFQSSMDYIKNDLLNRDGSAIIATLIVIVGLYSCIRGILVFKGFEQFWKHSMDDFGEKIEIEEYNKEAGVSFFVTYILPVLLDNMSTLRGLAEFVVLMTMMVALLQESNLYYQNPILTIAGYKVFRFRFAETTYSELEKNVYVGLTKGKEIETTHVVKRRKMEDEIYLLFND